MFEVIILSLLAIAVLPWNEQALRETKTAFEYLFLTVSRFCSKL